MNGYKKNINLYNKEYFSERDYLPSHLANVLEILLKENNIKKILEVGVGSGKLMKYLRKKGYEVKGIDVSPISAKLTGSVIASATKIPFKDSSFDCVLGISIIEHLSKNEGEQFIKEAYRVLKNKGIIFLVTPNFSSPLRYLYGKKWFGFSDRSHIFFYTPHSLKKILNKNNILQVVFKFKINSSQLDWPVPAFIHKFPSVIKYLINYLLVSTGLGLFRDSFWVMGRVKK